MINKDFFESLKVNSELSLLPIQLNLNLKVVYFLAQVLGTNIHYVKICMS